MWEAEQGRLGNRDFYCLEGHTSVSKGHDNKHRYAGVTPLAQAVGPFPALPTPHSRMQRRKLIEQPSCLA